MSKIYNGMLNGVIEIIDITTNVIVDESYGNALVAADPDGGSITITLPIGFEEGFSFKVMQISAGTVAFEAGIGATIYNSSLEIQNLVELIDVTSSIAINNEWLLKGNLV